MDKILQVKNLKISFRTSSGTLKAVRNISFDLERGKTLAIVGESGSGKSVTSKAVLGILAGNSIVEGGEILYDGRDLLKIDEEEMCTIRGNRISMIFQDPLSSLNPIVKIGRQITEAMLLKNKSNRRAARKEFNSKLALLKKHMIAACDGQDKAKIAAMCKTFDRFNIEGIKLENHYNTAYGEAESLAADIHDFLFLASKNQRQDVNANIKQFLGSLRHVKDQFLTKKYDAKLSELTAALKESKKEYHAPKKNQPVVALPESMTAALEQLEAVLNEMCAQTRPNFFRIGYYRLTNPNEDLTGKSVEELNEMTLTYLDDHFMKEFLGMIAKGLQHAQAQGNAKKAAVEPELQEAKKFFGGNFSKGAAKSKAKALAAKVEDSIDRLDLNKESATYSFRTAINTAIEAYFSAKKKNPKEESRFARQTKRRERLIARGRTVDWKVVPKTVYDLDELKAEIVACLDRVLVSYGKAKVSTQEELAKDSVALVDRFKSCASEVVYRVTKHMAKERAIKLMAEVGIAEPRVRYNQYPFEFSGGMRQRIVIAIALAADPDILICDEPTTALDVTIQAQILELINELKRERNLSVIFITHDLGVVANMADDIAVMYAGKIVEYGTADDVFYDPKHPYTWALLASMPDLDTKEKLDAIPGTPPNMIYPPKGDAFADRNKYAMQIDFEEQPPKFKVNDTHWAATWLLHPDAPEVEPPRIVTERIERMSKNGGNNA